MTKLIDASEGITSVKLDQSWKADFYIDTFAGWSLLKTYYPGDIQIIEEIDEDTYRSAGGAAAWAIAGGVLTGGIGFLAGAAFGGRRRQNTSFLVVFRDGQFVAFEERRKAMVTKLKTLLTKQKISGRLQTHPSPDPDLLTDKKLTLPNNEE